MRGARGCGARSLCCGARLPGLLVHDESCSDCDQDGYRELDCRDDLPSVHPGAEEVCGDGVDNSCDGAACGDEPEGAGGSGGTGG
ncbi:MULTISPECIES: putative metal-binding motif-containing protein [Sorangium]|uniref:putative metal-binding motif-containing protein n=1 Tax=Sorangium TaxID=39643 RepID=UPI001F330C1F